MRKQTEIVYFWVKRVVAALPESASLPGEAIEREVFGLTRKAFGRRTNPDGSMKSQLTFARDVVRAEARVCLEHADGWRKAYASHRRAAYAAHRGQGESEYRDLKREAEKEEKAAEDLWAALMDPNEGPEKVVYTVECTCGEIFRFHSIVPNNYVRLWGQLCTQIADRWVDPDDAPRILAEWPFLRCKTHNTYGRKASASAVAP